MAPKLLNLNQKILKFFHIHYAYETNQEKSVDDLKKTGLNRYVYGFNVDYDAIAVDDILDIYKYLMKKNNMIGIGKLELVLLLFTNT